MAASQCLQSAKKKLKIDLEYTVELCANTTDDTTAAASIRCAGHKAFRHADGGFVVQLCANATGTGPAECASAVSKKLDDNQIVILCEGAESDQPAKCFDSAARVHKISDSTKVRLCSQASSTEPISCWAKEVKKYKGSSDDERDNSVLKVCSALAANDGDGARSSKGASGGRATRGAELGETDLTLELGMVALHGAPVVGAAGLSLVEKQKLQQQQKKKRILRSGSSFDVEVWVRDQNGGARNSDSETRVRAVLERGLDGKAGAKLKQRGGGDLVAAAEDGRAFFSGLQIHIR